MTKLQTYIDRNKEVVELGSELLKRARQAEMMVNSLAQMLIDSASKGYVSSNDVDFANDCLDKLQSRRTLHAPDASPECMCPADGLWPGCPIHGTRATRR